LQPEASRPVYLDLSTSRSFEYPTVSQLPIDLRTGKPPASIPVTWSHPPQRSTLIVADTGASDLAESVPTTKRKIQGAAKRTVSKKSRHSAESSTSDDAGGENLFKFLLRYFTVTYLCNEPERKFWSAYIFTRRQNAFESQLDSCHSNKGSLHYLVKE
jgi:hypothetical protein